MRQRLQNISWVWLVPLLAASVGLTMVVHSTLSAGAKISVSFMTADGLESNKTVVKYKNVVIGKVTGIGLSNDRSHIDVTIELEKSANAFTARDSRYWVVRPRVSVGGVSGIDTLLSGAFIDTDVGESTSTQNQFKGLETPPPINFGEKGRWFTLHADSLGSLDIGSAVYYRRVQVGQVVSYTMADDGRGLDIVVFIRAPNDKFVTADTRFWNASGVDVSLGAAGLKVNTQSLSSIVSGGVAFLEPTSSSNPIPVRDQSEFNLFSDQEAALAPVDGESHAIRMVFDESLKGLVVGAPIELLGVNIGRVTSVELDFDANRQTFPSRVDALIFPARLGKANDKLLALMGGKTDDIAVARMIGIFIKKGLRAQVKNANLLTGQMYISLGFINDAPPVAFNPETKPLSIPTVPGSMDKLQEQLQAVVEKVGKLPIDRITSNLNGAVGEMQTTLKQVNNDVLPQMRDALAQAQKTFTSAADGFAEGSPQRQQLGQAMEEVQRTARSVRALTDLLSSHPEALIRGRTDQLQPSAAPL